MSKFVNFNDFLGEFDSLFGKSFDDFKKNIKTEVGKDSIGEFERAEYSSPDGSLKIVSFVRTSKNKQPDEISVLKNQMDEFVKKQEFEKAAEVRDKIKSLEAITNEVNSLRKELDEAVKNENFEKAIELRDKIKVFNQSSNK